MKYLTEYLNEKNRFRSLFKQPLLTSQTSKERQEIADCLGSDLSPETTLDTIGVDEYEMFMPDDIERIGYTESHDAS